jgi:hypothetical protein
MSELELVEDTKPAESRPGLLRRLFRAKDIGFYLMIALAWISSIYTTYNLHDSQFIWRWLIPIYGAICIFTQWNSVEPTLRSRALLVLHQLLHWGVVTALAFLVIMASTGQYGLPSLFDARQVGFIVTFMLALSTYLAGLYNDWRLCVVAGFLLLGEIINTVFTELAPLLVWLGLGLVAVYFLGAWLFRGREDRAPTSS